jgi:hypothetical protein
MQKNRPDIGRPDFAMSWQTLFHIFSQRSTGRLNAVCNTACTCHKVSDRELRGAVHVQTTQVTRYGGRLETRERGVFQVDTVPAIAGDCRTIPKHYYGAPEECHAITDTL